MMYYSDYDAGLEFTPQRNSAQSPYGYDDLEDWGYEEYEVSNKDYDYINPQYSGIGPALRSLGISDKATHDGGFWEPCWISHGKIPLNDVQTYVGPDGWTRRVGSESGTTSKHKTAWLTMLSDHWCRLRVRHQ
ncbi:hypothetical protein BU26DRAFT_140710 [Trematosphaeria pertusa]|uniref:Uncharacterized protein n=1 Tax=Trematosphaeria pertusa TaxID=390896 RepID=A0A6A6IVI0_9PLEO|nr:uncharacterized protein BU26DRAFT_140710 [Trematosphaeria pertusa]KAF2254561.1 hypothetical protein BU26DRAFT_140710 [Trematosphaeria pertusa]